MNEIYIKVNGIRYDVIQVDPMAIVLSSGKQYGACALFEKKIYLANNIRRDVFKQVLIHEIIHAVIYEYGIKEDKDETTWTEEDLCVFFQHYGEEIMENAGMILKMIFIH